MPDLIQRFLFDDFPVRGEVVQLSQTLSDVFANHAYPKPIKELLGKFMAAASLLSATIKFEGSLILQVRGAGQVSMLMAECKNQTQLRAIAHYKDQGEDQFDPSKPILGEGSMAITIEPKKGERYQGIVSITDGSLEQVIENYFMQSEQLKTRLWLSASETKAAGMLLQAMPASASESSMTMESEDWDRVVHLSDTVKEEELLELEINDILHRLFHEETLRLFETSSLEFECSCSTERTANALISIGETEARSLLAEENGLINIDCQFCLANYQFDEKAVDGIFHSRVH